MPAKDLSPQFLCLVGSFFFCLLSALSRLQATQIAMDFPIGNIYFPIAPFHIAMGFALVLIGSASVYSVFHRFSGRHLNSRLGQLHFLLTLAGGCVLMLVLQMAPMLSNLEVRIVLWLAVSLFVVGQVLFGFCVLWSVLK